MSKDRTIVRIALISILLAFIIMLSVNPVSAQAWWNNNCTYRYQSLVSSAVIPYQYPVYISNAVGNNDENHIYFNGLVNNNYSNVFFVQNSTIRYYFIENSTTNLTWVNVTSSDTLEVYYGGICAGNGSEYNNPNMTFPFFSNGDSLDNFTVMAGSPAAASGEITLTGAADEILRSNMTFGVNTAIRTRMKLVGSGAGSTGFGYTQSTGVISASIPEAIMQEYDGILYFQTYNTGLSQVNLGASDDAYHTFKIARNSLTSTLLYRDDTLLYTQANQIYSDPLYFHYQVHNTGDSAVVDWAFLLNFTYPEPELGIFTSILLYSPESGQDFSVPYPPLLHDIDFSWINLSADYYSFQVATDSSFNVLVKDILVDTNTTTQALETGTYYWRVATYNITTGLGGYSSAYTFTITPTYSTTNTTIHGIVYQFVNNTKIPLTGATVYLYNTSYSSQQTVGSNGYFLFPNLVNETVYYIKASLKDYQTSEIITITTGNGTTTTYNIELRPAEPTYFEPDKQYVLFETRWLYCLFNCSVPGTTITVYKYGEATEYLSGITDSTGSISFLLFKTQLYRITVINSTAGINQEMTLYPKDTSYIILITNTDTPFQDHTVLEKDAITTNVTKSIINTTHAYVNVTYNDTLNQTTAITIYLNQTNSTMLSSFTTTGNATHSFLLSNYSGQSYFVHIVATHSTYGQIDNTYSVMFEKSSVGIDGIPQELWLWFMIGIMFFTGAIFTASTAEIGLIIVCAEGWIGLAAGAFSTLNTTQFGIGLTLVSIIAIMAYMNQVKKKEGYT